MKILVLSACLLVVTSGMANAQRVEHFVEAPGPTGTLKGTMLGPQSGARNPVMVIIPGSGPTDRDGNNPLGVKASSYRLLAEALADRGITTVRIDKRGLFANASPAVDPNNVTIADYAADIRAWTARIKELTGAPCVWLGGHSEGGLVATVTAPTDPNACGLVLISAPGRRLSDILREQFRSNPANAPLLDQALQAISQLEAGEKVDISDLHPALKGLFRPATQGFLISMFSYDPAEILAGYGGPVLVVQGTSDLQISMADAERLAAARPGTKLIRLKGVNHILKVAPVDDRAANLATYADPGLALAPNIADEIAAFIRNPPR